MTDPTKPTPLRKACPACGGSNVRATIAQAAEGRPGPDGKPVKAGAAIHQCADCGAIVAAPKPTAAKKKPAAAKKPSGKKSSAKKSSAKRRRSSAGATSTSSSHGGTPWFPHVHREGVRG